MIKDNFVRNSVLLTLSNLTTGILGFIFSIILSRELGAEGLGLYGLVMPVYNLFICLICGGIITAVSKSCAEHLAKNAYNNIKKSIKTTMTFNILWSAIIVTLVMLLSMQISKYMIRDSRTLYAFRITCPAMVFISLSNTLKGYFYGTNTVLVPALIDIFEKSIRIIVLFSISKIFITRSVTFTVTAAYAALCLGEFISLVLLFTAYKIHSRKFPHTITKAESSPQLLFDVLVVSLPLCVNGFVATALSTISTLILPRRLILSGISYTDALETIGRFAGMAMNIVVFPMIVINSISLILIPDLSQSLIKKDYYSVKKRISTVFNLSILLGLSTFIICSINGKSLGQMFYSRDDLGAYIALASIPIPFLFLSACTYSILNGLSKQSVILRTTIMMSLLELFLLYVLTAIPFINVYGCSITMFVTSVITIFLNVCEINKIIEVELIHNSLITLVINFLVFYYITKLTYIYYPAKYIVSKNIIIAVLGFGFTFFSMGMGSFFYQGKSKVATKK